MRLLTWLFKTFSGHITRQSRNRNDTCRPKATCRVQPFGELSALAGKPNERIEWIPVNFASLPLEFSITGDTHSPVFESATTISEIINCPERIQCAIARYLEFHDLGFNPGIVTCELDHACFNNPANSASYVATCLAEFRYESAAFPAVGCAGNGFWDLKFQMNRFEVIGYIEDSE